jgi:starch-binding outer membrane protein, SusD/RagB family
MKRLLIIFLLLLNNLSCKKLFKEDIQNTFTLNTERDYAVAMAGLYNRLFNGIMGNNLILLFAIANEDDMKINGTGGNEINCPTCTLDINSNIYCQRFKCDNLGSGESCVSGNDYDFTIIYKLLFQAVGSANDIISKAGNINRLKSGFKICIGEVYFIRAYCYFRLARLYGQIPLVDNPDVDYTLKKPSFIELYNFMVSDLKKAMALLPKNNNEARIPYETPHRGTAKALLAEVYLTEGGYPVYDNSKYAEAAREAGEVIDSASYYGFGLMPDVADLWNGSHQKNMESEFAIHFIDPSKDLSNGLENLNSEIFALAEFHGLGEVVYQSISRRYSECCAAKDFYNSYPRNYRKEVTFQTRHAPFNYTISWDSILNKYNYKFDTLLRHYDTINKCTSIPFKKFYTQFNIPDSILVRPYTYYGDAYERYYSYYKCGTVYMFRYAHTLLTYAEAKARIGSVDANAYEAVNKIRRRANKLDINSPSSYDLTPGLSPEQFADSVVQERAWELCAEPEGRWFDMVRLNIASDLVAIKHHQGIMVYPIPVDRNTYFLPIPEKDKLLNPNLR